MISLIAMLAAGDYVPAGTPARLGRWECAAPSIRDPSAKPLRFRLGLRWPRHITAPARAIAVIERSSSSDFRPGRYDALYDGTYRPPARPWFQISVRDRTGDWGSEISFGQFDHDGGTAHVTAGPVITGGDVTGPVWAFEGKCELMK